MNIILLIAGIATVAMAGTHAILGESRLIAPLYNDSRSVLSDPVLRDVLRLAWHFTTAFILVTALVLFVAAANANAVDHRIVVAIGVTYLIAGLVDLVVTNAKHDAWPLLMAVGTLVLFA